MTVNCLEPQKVTRTDSKYRLFLDVQPTGHVTMAMQC